MKVTENKGDVMVNEADINTNKNQSAKQVAMLAILKALAHPIRLKIIVDLINDKDGAERHCTSFGLTVAKATRSHHFKLLKDVGLISHIDRGNHSLAKLRREELEEEFPGLIGLLSNL